MRRVIPTNFAFNCYKSVHDRPFCVDLLSESSLQRPSLRPTATRNQPVTDRLEASVATGRSRRRESWPTTADDYGPVSPSFGGVKGSGKDRRREAETRRRRRRGIEEEGCRRMAPGRIDAGYKQKSDVERADTRSEEKDRDGWIDGCMEDEE